MMETATMIICIFFKLLSPYTKVKKTLPKSGKFNDPYKSISIKITLVKYSHFSLQGI